MTKYIMTRAQSWHPVNVRGVTMEACPLWEGKYNVRAGFFRMPQGMQISQHRHDTWVQVLVLSGKMQVEAVGAEAQTLTTGEYYFVEPGETHVETALEDTLALVVAEEDRDSFRQKPML